MSSVVEAPVAAVEPTTQNESVDTTTPTNSGSDVPSADNTNNEEEIKRKRLERFGPVEDDAKSTDFRAENLDVDLSDLIAKGKKNKKSNRKRKLATDKETKAPPAKEVRTIFLSQESHIFTCIL